MKRRATAVLHLRSQEDAASVLQLARKVIAAMRANAQTFPNPDPPIDDLEEEADELERISTEASGGSHQAVQDKAQQSAFLYGMLRNQVAYVNRLANGDRAIILLSGFDASDEPNPRPIPGHVPIQRIEDGPTPPSAKLMVETLGEPVDYIVQMLDGAGTPGEWKTVLETGNSRALIVEGLERAKEVHFRVAARNARGQGPWSDSVPFIPR